MIYKFNETVSAKALADLRETVGWNRMEKGYASPLMISLVSVTCFVDSWKLIEVIKQAVLRVAEVLFFPMI